MKVGLFTRPNNSKASLIATSQVALITCMMSAEAPDTAGPDCWSKLELDFALVEVDRHCLHLHIDHQNHRAQEDNRENHQHSTFPPPGVCCCVLHVYNHHWRHRLHDHHDHYHHHHHHQECIADGLGDVLHAANGEETSAVANPPVTNVPWSNFDGLPFLLL